MEKRLELQNHLPKSSLCKENENNSMPCMLLIQVMHSKPCSINAGYLKIDRLSYTSPVGKHSTNARHMNMMHAHESERCQMNVQRVQVSKSRRRNLEGFQHTQVSKYPSVQFITQPKSNFGKRSKFRQNFKSKPNFISHHFHGKATIIFLIHLVIGIQSLCRVL